MMDRKETDLAKTTEGSELMWSLQKSNRVFESMILPSESLLQHNHNLRDIYFKHSDSAQETMPNNSTPPDTNCTKFEGFKMALSLPDTPAHLEPLLRVHPIPDDPTRII